MFKFSLESLGTFPIFDDLVSRKRLGVERNGLKCGPQGSVFSVYRVLLSVKYSSSFGVFRSISDFRRHCCISEKANRTIRTKCWPSGVSILLHIQ